jgi:hypothetical protein
MVYTFEHLGRTQGPWKECKPMDERLKFIARLLEGEKMARPAGCTCTCACGAAWSIASQLIEPVTPAFGELNLSNV